MQSGIDDALADHVGDVEQLVGAMFTREAGRYRIDRWEWTRRFRVNGASCYAYEFSSFKASLRT
ncbi:MAG: hypothetical protein ACRENI_02700 [Gemmatimonadaceae bacterium]